MPALIRFVIVEVGLGFAVGAIFLAGLLVADVYGLGGLLVSTGQPRAVVLAVVFSALGPFALCFMATALSFHRWDD